MGSSRTYVVRKPFKASGKTFKRGERFRSDRLAVSDRRVRQLIEWNFLADNEPQEQPKQEQQHTDPHEAAAERLQNFRVMELKQLAQLKGVMDYHQLNKQSLIQELKSRVNELDLQRQSL